MRSSVNVVLPISEGYALKYFVLYALVCSTVGIVLLVVIHQIAPFDTDGPNHFVAERMIDDTATGTVGSAPTRPNDLVVGSTPSPNQPPVQRSDQWDLRPTNSPAEDPFNSSVARKGGRVGTPMQ
ncbi:hypothetical protein VCM43_02675 [Rhizobium sp. MJ21]|nr:hypothetical protein [Rhizobium sp. MJ21]MEB3042549.1 hypothetical protein [Rhizobium sp. MJ21]